MKPKFALFLAVLLPIILANPVAAEEKKPVAAKQINTTASELNAITANANKGDASAQFDLGVIYRQGDGTPKDAAKAVVWFKKAAEQGYAAAAFDLGTMYRHG